MSLDRALERALKDPETRVKVYLAFNISLLLVNLSMAFGLLFLLIQLCTA